VRQVVLVTLDEAGLVERHGEAHRGVVKANQRVLDSDAQQDGLAAASAKSQAWHRSDYARTAIANTSGFLISQGLRDLARQTSKPSS